MKSACHCVITCATRKWQVERCSFTITLTDLVDLTSPRIASKLHQSNTENKCLFQGKVQQVVMQIKSAENRGKKPGELRGRRCLDHHKMHQMFHCRGGHQNLLSSPSLVHVDAERTELPLQCSQRHKSPWDLGEQHDVLVALLMQSQGVD